MTLTQVDNCPSTISIMPSLSHDPTTIEAPIISGYSRARLAVRSKPVRLNIRSGLMILVELLVSREPCERVINSKFLLLWFANKQPDWYSERP